MLKDKNIVIGVCGGIAAYKICGLVSSLKKNGANVYVVMTKNAVNFVTPLTFETLSGNRVITDSFDRNFEWDVKHISLAKKADLIVVAPATANILAKTAHGIADDFLTTLVTAAKSPVMFAPAMNTAMLENQATQENIDILRHRGFKFIYGGLGKLACGDIGAGRMAESEQIQESIIDFFKKKNDYKGKTVLVTAGATQEDIDGVRCITNYSSGKMGLAIAAATSERGAKVIFISGKTSVKTDGYAFYKEIKVVSTAEMFDAVMDNLDSCDYIIKAAAPADYRVLNKSNSKIKMQSLELKLEKTQDIAKEIGKRKKKQKLIIFCAETENLIENAKKKMSEKNADMVIANDLTTEGAGFNCDTNVISIITPDKTENLEKALKTELAEIILDRILKL